MNDSAIKLETSISNSWDHLESAVRSRDRFASQSALNRVLYLEDLKQQQLKIEESINASVASDATVLRPQRQDQLESPRVSFGSPGKRKTIRPKEIKFGTFRKAIQYANEIPITIANWLIGQGKSLPTFPNFIHPSNSDFSRSAITKRLNSGQFIEVGDNQEVLLQKGRRLLDACGFSGLRIEVLLVDGNLLTA